MNLVQTNMLNANLRRTLQVAILSIIFGTLPLLAQVQRHPNRHVRMFVPNRYTVILSDAPVSSRFATREDMQTSVADAYRLQIKAAQTALKANIESRGMHVTGSVTDLLNALFVTATLDHVAELQSLPGVAAVRPMRVSKLTLNAAIQAMNAPAAWNLVGGQSNAGAGIKIGLIDTGIDQTHPTFQDPSLSIPSGFPKCTTGYPADCAYTTNKVIVARSYVRQIAMDYVVNPSNPAPQSDPDDYSPRDRVGHGTATASCAAGFTNTGAASALAGGLVTFNGMAPKAYLGNYKVSGSPGVNDGTPDDVLIQAVEDAVADGMDIISISIGSIALTGATEDPVASAYQAAAQKVVVVAAAGNDGDDTSFYTTGIYPYENSISSPGTAPSAITVGATVNSHILNSTVSATASGVASNLKNILADVGDSYLIQAANGATIAPLVDVTTLGDNGLACNSGTLPTGSLIGAIALIERGSCTFDVKAVNAQTAGAVGVIFYNDPTDALASPGGISTDFIGPTVMIANSDGLNLKAYIAAHAGASATIDYSGVEQTLAAFSTAEEISPPLAVNQFASYSSVGPTPDGLIKPDLVATGGDDNAVTEAQTGMYFAVQNYDPNGEVFSANRYASADGTSFSTPLVAGAAALVKQAHPSYSPAQIKSTLVNAASQATTVDDYLGYSVDVQEIGGGLLSAGAAVASTVWAQPSTLSFGYLTSALPAAQTVTLTNTGSSSVTLAVAVAQLYPVTGTSVTATPASITLAAGASGTISVSVTGKVPVAGEYSGGITLTGGGVSLRLPYMYLVGDGILDNANVNTISTFVSGYPGQDGGSLIMQMVDEWGVPIAGVPVTFSTPSRGSMTFASYGFGEPACAKGTGTGSMVCNTDQFGFAYTEVTLGSAIGSPLINIVIDGQTYQGQADIVAQPTISTAGVLNDATFQAPIAPGSYIAIFGTNLLDTNNLSNYSVYNNVLYDTANSTNSPTDGSLPLQIDYTSVTFDVPSAGISVPGYLNFVSPTQVNVWVPWELAGQSSVQMKVSVDEGFWGNVVTVPLSSTAPGFFLSSNVAVAQDQNYKLITSANPAVPGQAIVLYCNGLGPVNNQPADGAPASGTNLSSTTTTPVVTIGGQSAQVIFSGLTPNFVGLYQVNVYVPAGLSAGNQPITIAIGGQTSPSKTAGSSPQTIMLPVK